LECVIGISLLTGVEVQLRKNAGGEYASPASPLLSCLHLFVASIYGLAQEGAVTVVDPGSRELKRTAHWLQMPPEQLKNSRLALQEATELIKEMDPMPEPALGDLATLWVDLNRPKAVVALEGLNEKVRTRMQPELILKTLDLLPELKAKAEQAGGIDKLLAGARVSVSRRVPCPPAVGAGTRATEPLQENPAVETWRITWRPYLYRSWRI
jgi:hypothetical protein